MIPTMSERDAKVMRDFPDLFGPTPPGGRTSPLGWGLAIGEGWMPLLLDLLAELRVVVAEEGLEPFRIRQVKEKFGTMRVHVSHAHPRVASAIRRAEARVATTREACGAAGRLRTDRAHVQTLCDRHAASRRTERG